VIDLILPNRPAGARELSGPCRPGPSGSKRRRKAGAA